jgi:hypothetical protein
MQLSFAELSEGLLRLRVVPAIALTEEDFDRITDVLCPDTHNISILAAQQKAIIGYKDTNK